MTSRGSIGNRRFSHSKKSNKKRNLKYERTINMKLHTLIPISILVICIGHLPNIKAVSPAPDGGYPRGPRRDRMPWVLANQAARSTRQLVFFRLQSVTTGSFNTGIGAGTLLANTADENTATGAGCTFKEHHRRPQYGQWNVRALKQY